MLEKPVSPVDALRFLPVPNLAVSGSYAQIAELTETLEGSFVANFSFRLFNHFFCFQKSQKEANTVSIAVIFTEFPKRLLIETFSDGSLGPITPLMHQFLLDFDAHLDMNHAFKPANADHSPSQTHKLLYDQIKTGIDLIHIMIKGWRRFKYEKFIKWLLMLTFFTVNKHRPDDQKPTHLTYAGNDCFYQTFFFITLISIFVI